MKSPKHALRVLAAAAVATLLLAAPAQADILLEFDELIFGAEGSVRTVGQVDVPVDMVARSCQISVIAENQASVHPGNDLIVSTGDSQAVIVGVEDEVNGGTVETYQVIVGPSIVVHLRFGEDEMSSLGFGLSFDCEQTVPTTVASGLDGQLVTGGDSSTTTSPTTIASTVPAPSCDDGAPGATSPSDAVSTIDDPTATTVVGEAATVGTCPEPAAAQGPSPSTTTTAPQPVVAPTTAVSTTAAATPALPPSPVASAIVAAPAYAG